MSFLHHPLRCACVGAGGRAAGGTALFYPSSISAPRLRLQQVCGPHLTSTAGAGAPARSHALAHTGVCSGTSCHHISEGGRANAPPGFRASSPVCPRRSSPPALPESTASATGSQRARLCVELAASTKVVCAFFGVHRSRLPCGRGREAPIKRGDDAAWTHLRLTGEKNNSGRTKKSGVEKKR